MTRAHLEDDELARLEDAATNLRDHLIIRVLSHLGCATTETLNIAVDDIDFTSSTIRILPLKTRLELSCPKCTARVTASHIFCQKCGERVQEAVVKELENSHQRVILVDSETLSMMKEYIDRGGPVIRNGRKLLFGINRHRLWQIVVRCAEKAGLPTLTNTETGRTHYVSPDRLRDAFTAHAVKLDNSYDGIRMLQAHLGHKSISTTTDGKKLSQQELNTWYSKLWETEKDDESKTQT
jgi:integrase/recombinase XerD